MTFNRSIAIGLTLALCLMSTATAAPVDDAIKALPAYKPGDDATPLKTIEQAAQAVTAGQGDRLALSNQLLGVLADPNATVHAKRFVCGQLVLVGGDEAVEPLTKLLTDAELVNMSCYALGRIGTEKATGRLIEYLDRVEGDSRVTLINTIGLRGDAKAVPVLADIADEGPTPARTAAVHAIGNIGGADAARQLIAMAPSLKGADTKLIAAYFEAATKCAEIEAMAGRLANANALLDAVDALNPSKVVALAVQRGRLLATTPAEVPAKLLVLFSDDEADVTRVAAAYLRDDAKPATVTALLVKADQLTPAAHVVAIQAAASQNNTDAIGHVRKAVADDHVEVRLAAIEALGDLGTRDDLPLLIKTAAGDDEVATAARKVLVTFNPTGAEQAMLAQLNTQTGPAQVALIEVLATRRMGAAAPPLLTLARDKDQAIRHAALRALGDCAEAEHVDALVGLVAQPVAAEDIGPAESAARAVFGRVRDAERCAAALLQHLKTAAPPSKVALMRLMPAAPTDASLNAVRSQLDASDETLRDAAIRALIAWPGNASMADLRKIAESSDSKKYRVLTLRGYIDRASSAKDLAAAMKLAERREEKLAVLGRLPNDAAGVDIAAAAMADKSLQREAIDALIRIAEKVKPDDVTNLASPLRQAAAMTKDAKTTERLNKAIAKHGADTE